MTTNDQRDRANDNLGDMSESQSEPAPTTPGVSSDTSEDFGEGMGAVENTNPTGPMHSLGRDDTADAGGASGNAPGTGTYSDDEDLAEDRTDPPEADPSDRTATESDSPGYPSQSGGDSDS